MDTSLIVQSVFSLGNIALGGSVAYIAWQQYKTNRDKLRLDLFEKRYAVYKALMDYLRKTGGMEYPELIKQHTELRIGTHDAKFLFDKDVTEFLSEIYSKSAHYRRVIHDLQDRNPSNHERYKLSAKEECELLDWFDAQLNRARDVFSPYLSFNHKG